MSQKLPAVPDPHKLLPPSALIQQRLGEAIRAERLLRQMLRLALRAEREREAVPRAS
jgi:hypothetical protein